MAPNKRTAGKKDSPPKKKAKVEDPVETAISKVSSAINFELSDELAPRVVSMVVATIPECLAGTVEERSPIETEFAKLVGEAVRTAQKGLDAKAAEAAKGVTEKQAEVAALEAAVGQATTVKTDCESAAENAATAEREAKEAKTTTADALATQQDEEAKLPGQIAKLETDRKDVEFALGVVRGDAPVPKDAKKLTAQLAKLGAPDAIVAGVTAAVGKDGMFEKMVVGEATKLLETKLAELQGQQAAAGQRTTDMAAKTTKLVEEVAALTTAHDERKKELKDAKAKLAAAVQAIKDAELTKKKGDKALEKQQGASATAVKDAEACRDVYSSYEWLLTRTGAKAEEDPAAGVEA